MAVIELHPSLTPAQKLEGLKNYQRIEQGRCQKHIGLLRDALLVPDADDRMIKSAFDQVAIIVNKISDIGAAIRSMEAERPKRTSFFELAKDICAPPRIDVFETDAKTRAEILRPFGREML